MKTDPNVRVRIIIRGAVQGVGFRPFVYRLASELKLTGWVSNTAQGVFIEAEGSKELLDQLLLRLEKEKPVLASIQSFEFSYLDPVDFGAFEIKESGNAGAKTALILPDIATCPECLSEIFDPANRRYRYPFTNCTHCGPRYSIIEALPYDRPNTSMKRFAMCPACRKEYEDPSDRRFHAQPTACPECGPALELWNERGEVIGRFDDALLAAAKAIRNGQVVAVKGIGGFHLMADARSEEAVQRLRDRKHREEKPFALMFPTLKMIEEECLVSDFEKRLLQSPEAPIVLLQKKDNAELYGTQISNLGLAKSVAPQNPNLGVLLPYTPLHHLLMRELMHPVVATSGNLSDEPICTDEREAIARLRGIADVFLVHNRPIVRHIDDSIVRVLMGRELMMRRARGYAPLPIHFSDDDGAPVLAVGAHLKNTVALAVNGNVFISQHIGDLETRQSLEAFRKVSTDLQEMFEIRPVVTACDMHPDYFSSKEARRGDSDILEVQHHHAHVLSCMAENQLEGEVLGVAWDGTGYGTDGTIWGGEFLITSGTGFERFAAFKPFRLPGAEKAIKEPRRTAAGILFEIFGDEIFRQREVAPMSAFSVAELSVVLQMLKNKVNAPLTSSVGRLFDGVASIVGLRHRNSFEAQAAMELEFALSGEKSEQLYRCNIVPTEQPAGAGVESRIGAAKPSFTVDWSQMVKDIWKDVRARVPVPLVSKKLHNALVESIIDVARAAACEAVVLSGGCFQNRYLSERAIARLRAAGFKPYWHQRVPSNDGGISLGQVHAARNINKAQGKHRDEITAEEGT